MTRRSPFCSLSLAAEHGALVDVRLPRDVRLCCFAGFQGIAGRLPRSGGRRAGMCAVSRPSQDGESGNPVKRSDLGLLRRERPFSLVRFFLALKRNELGRVSGRKLLSFNAKRAFQANKQDQTLSSAGAASFISFDKRHCVRSAHANGAAGPKGERQRRESKKRTKEKRFPDHSSPTTEGLSGFFDSPSWLGRKTAHIHVRRPLGLPAAKTFRCVERAERKQIHKHEPAPRLAP